ncbi:MAG: sigma-70 family RNA polymerase sigma factor [Actinomycetota bacterium]
MSAGISEQTVDHPRRRAEDRLDGAFDELYRTHRPDLVSYATRRRADDPELLADMALVDLYKARNRLRDDLPQVRWAYLYRALDSHLARERSKTLPEPVAEPDGVDWSAPFDDSVAAHLDLHDALIQLPPDQEAAIRARFFDGLTSAEAGEALGKSAVAVRQLQHVGLKNLRRILFALAVTMVVAIGVVGAWLAGRATDVENTPIDGPSTTTTQVSSEMLVGNGPPPTAVATGDVEPPVASTVTSAVEEYIPIVHAEDLLAYEGFFYDVPDGSALPHLPEGRDSTGFDPDGTWDVFDGQAAFSYHADGLTYVDAAGARLATTPGALALTNRVTEQASMQRAFATRPAVDGTHWISFLLRPDLDVVGDAFWHPTGGDGRGAVGIQERDHYQIVNGPITDASIVTGQTVLLLVRTGPGGTALWVDPLLGDPGPPDVETPEWDDIGSRLGFAIIRHYGGAYTVDEFRVGSSAASVLPTR